MKEVTEILTGICHRVGQQKIGSKCIVEYFTSLCLCREITEKDAHGLLLSHVYGPNI